jgi:uncharacterized protein YndB with AHSA1/START domain
MLNPANDEAVVHVQRTLPFPVDAVFGAWLDADLAKLFLFAAPHGVVEETLIDARVGGAFSVIDRRGDHNILHTGEFTRIERPTRLSFTFRVPAFHAHSTPIHLHFAPAEGGGTYVVLDAGHVPPAMRDRATFGWTMMLDRLGFALESRDADVVRSRILAHAAEVQAAAAAAAREDE